ncbi:DNA polymerase III, delta-prime subunit [Geotalea daltonii FRC-32]|uniref:DNA polymerase III subunit delta' n=1 Tax=Geotalea daltonii (strain DSM 22248 / JCM 15807 / FRC-32) TaxID=316067 RepID=B9M909_GEODF|nr:DNA polymerase III subunit delta' [Geotalea daltonii]ACM20505.1 DNA polymerase III, delta-prime subunit [Geotalea daltonii FRC-32]
MSFADILGQDTPISVLKRSLAAGRLAHAYLFEGVEGCGKKTTALALIEAVFCGKGDGCGHCPSCRKISSMQHPDMHLIEPDGAFIKIDQIRSLQKELAYRPFEAPKKACIIDGAERLNQAAGNALLKTLEEPSGNALIILVTSQPSVVLPTILSRCQRLVFHGLPEETITSYLISKGVENESAHLSASLAGGSINNALEISKGEILSERKQLLTRLFGLSLTDIAPLFLAAEELAAEKEKAVAVLEVLMSFLRDMLLHSAGDTDMINTDLLPLLEEQGRTLSRARIMEKIEHVASTRTALLRNVNTRLALEVLFMRLAER